jgi:GT2 family glycosyltransferase
VRRFLLPYTLLQRCVKVSFIIPLYNRLDLTRPCLESLRATLPAGLDHEILLVDDGSTDGTREWIQTLGTPYRVFLNERNLGYAGTNNRGAAAATGDILALLNSDLILTRRWLEPMLATLRRAPRAGIVGNVQSRAATGELDHIGFAVELTGKPCHDASRLWLWAPWRSRETPAVTAACLLVQRDLFLRLRGFDEGFRNGGEDVDLCFRARALGYSCHVALHSRILHHVSASPGRKLHDEQNSRRLALRWHDEFLRLNYRRHREHHRLTVGLPQCLEYLRLHWADPRDFDRSQLAHIMLFMLRLRIPLSEIAAQQLAAMQVEAARWEQLLGPAPANSFVSSLPGVGQSRTNAATQEPKRSCV